MDTELRRFKAWVRRTGPLRLLLILALALWCFFEVRFLIYDLRKTYESSNRYIAYQHRRATSVVEPETPEQIQSWMTFGYVNFVFGLPANYLKERLALSEERYPNIQIGRYASREKLDPALFLRNVQQAVREVVS